MRLCLARSSDLHFERISRAPCHLNRSHRTPFLAADADRRFSPVAIHSKPCLNPSTGVALDDIVRGRFVASGWALRTGSLLLRVCNRSRRVTSLSVVVTTFSPPHGAARHHRTCPSCGQECPQWVSYGNTRAGLGLGSHNSRDSRTKNMSLYPCHLIRPWFPPQVLDWV